MQSATLETRVFHHKGQAIPYCLRRSRRATRVRLEVKPDEGVVLTVPSRTHPDDGQLFLQRHAAWLNGQLKRQAAIAAQWPRRWPYGTTLPYRGAHLPVEVRGGHPASVHMQSGALTVHVKTVEAAVDAARRALRAWYMAEADRFCLESVRQWADAMKVEWKGFSIGRGLTRWGSCSPAGSLRFNYRLIMAPQTVLDYVVVHELAHRRQMNHSPAFWNEVSRHFPEFRQARRWLSTFGPYLNV